MERSFLDSILAAPDDDVPRLIFADWLEENGRMERAEFIRVQCELAQRGCVDVWCEKISREKYPIGKRCELADECDALRIHESELLHAHWIAWTAGMGAGYCMNLYYGRPFSPPNRAIAFWRGFVGFLMCSAEDWFCHADELLRLAPIQEVELTTLPTVIRKTGKLRLKEWPHSSRMWGFLGREAGCEIRGSSDPSRRAMECLKVEWPGIKFTLPAISGYPVPPQIATAIEEVMADLELIDPTKTLEVSEEDWRRVREYFQR